MCRRSHPQILVVDDERLCRLLTRRMLRSAGFIVVCAASASEARLQLARRHFDMVISDFMMPDESGIAFLSRLSEEQPEIIRVLLTGSKNENIRSEAYRQANVHRVLNKPLSQLRLLDTVETLFADSVELE